MLALISHALVSLHSHDKDVGQAHFVCSGVLIAPGVVLTVGHVFNNHELHELWIRPQVSRIDALCIKGAVNHHPNLDAAWFSIERHPQNAETLPIDDEKTFRPGVEYQLYAYSENSLREKLPRHVTASDPLKSGYITQPLHQPGMSGGALCRNGAMWGMAYERYTEVSDNSGCVLGMHQLWDGFLEQVPGIRRLADAPQAAMHTTAAAAATHAFELEALRRIFRDLFSDPPLRDWNWPAPLVEGIPRRLHEMLKSAGRDHSEQVVDWVIELTDAINTDVGRRRLSIQGLQKPIRDLLCEAMGKAARLCLDPAQLAGLQPLQQALEVAAATPRGATLAVRGDPHLSWQEVHRAGEAPTFNDRYCVTDAIESGVGTDANYAILSAIVSLRCPELNPTGESIVVNEANLSEWRGPLFDQYMLGCGRCLIVGDRYRSALPPERIAWLNECSIAVVILGGGSTLFWFDEVKLLGRIQGFLNRFKKFTHWETQE